MSQKLETKGFSVVEVLVVVLIVAALGLGGFFVWQRSNDDTAKKTNTNTSQDDKQKQDDVEEKKTNDLSLAGDSVRVTLPTDWTFAKSAEECLVDATATVTCKDGATITPGAKLPTRYGNGTEHFNIKVSVFDNPQQSSPQTWIEKDFEEGTAGGTDEASHTPINGYDTYFWKKKFSGDGTTVEEVRYVFAAGDKTVLIYARTYEPGTLNDGTKVGDFRQFESAIADMSKSISIK